MKLFRAPGIEKLKLRSSRVRFGKVMCNLYHARRNSLGKVHAAVLLYGLPGRPKDDRDPQVRGLVERGWLVACPEYEGTFGSYGECDFANSVETALATARFLKGGHALDLLGEKALRWKTKEIVFIGGSFGGSVALVAGARSPLVQKIVALAAPAQYLGRDLKKDYPGLIRRAYENTWRIKRGAYKKLLSGEAGVNPIDFAEQLASKRVLLVHGTADDEVLPSDSKMILHAIEKAGGECELWLLKGVGHGKSGIGRYLDNPKALNQTLAWLNNQ